MEEVAFEMGDRRIIRFWATDIGNLGKENDTSQERVKINIELAPKVIL